jgi:transposase InsO family protein
MLDSIIHGASMSKPALTIPLPKSWPAKVRSAMLHVVSLAKYAAVYTRSWAADCPRAQVRLRAERDQYQEDNRLLREELRIKDARMASTPAHQRPFYRPTERLAILELRAARGWSLDQTAKAFLVCPKTIATWMKRLDEKGADALAQLPVPVNKFPDFVRYAVQRLGTLCPTLGKKKLSEVLARAGLHLGTTTIGRIRREKPSPFQPATSKGVGAKGPTITAKRPNHVWHVDLTTVPTQLGLWCPWSPFAWPQSWPWCWWVTIILDHYSRRIMGLGLFRKPPTSAEVRSCLGRAIAIAGIAPRHLVSDKGSQFFPTAGYKKWCRHRGIRPRFGALGKHGSVAVLERAIRTMKEGLHWTIVPTRREALRTQLFLVFDWYNQHRPHGTLAGKTPDEVYFQRFPAHRRPRFEPRAGWPRGSPCARPHALVAGKSGARFDLAVEHVGGHAHLPIVRLRRAA